MDPITAIGLAASIIAVIQLTGALIAPVTSSLGPSENDERELKNLLSTITGFQTAYNNLEHYLKSNPGQAESLVIAIKLPIENCNAVLLELNLRLSRMTFVRKHIIGRKWDKSFQSLVKRLDDTRHLFEVILQGDQSERLIKISQYIEQRSEDFETIKEGVQNTEKRLSELHLTLQSNQKITEARAAQGQSELRSAWEGLDEKVENHFSRIEKEEQRKLKDNILRWLSVADPRSNHERACKSHKAGTGDWFTKGPKYRDWLAKPHLFFWLNGKAGCGKTVLSSTIIEQTVRHGEAPLLDELSQSTKAHVLVTSRREHDITEYMSECKEVTDISIQNRQVDNDILLYIREQLKEDKKLKKWAAWHTEIEEVLSSKADGINSKLVALGFDGPPASLTPSKKCPSIKRVRDALQNLPKTLDETYERILLDTDEEYRDVIVEALRRLCFSERTLTVRELAEAAVFSAYVEPPSKKDPLEIIFDEDALFQDHIDILGFLSGLVVCVPEHGAEIDEISISSEEDKFSKGDKSSRSALTRDSPKNISQRSRILLSHFSVKEYLVSGRLRNEVEQFCMDEDHAHEILSNKCLYYVLHQKSSAKYLEHIRGPTFFKYAKMIWRQHACKVDYESELTGLIISVLMTEHELRMTFLSDLHYSESISPSLTPLYIASSLGLYWPTKALLESGVAVNVQGGERGNALQAAAGRGHPCQERIVQLLLDHGADVNMGGKYGNSLQVVSYAGHISIAKLLIDYGADVNMQCDLIEGFSTPLEEALAGEERSIIQLLLNHGANVNTEAGYYDWYINGDREYDSETLVMLLENGAVFSKYRRGIGAEEAFARKDFKGFAEILRKNWEEEREKKRERERERRKEEFYFSQITNNSE